MKSGEVICTRCPLELICEEVYSLDPERCPLVSAIKKASAE